MIADAPWRIEHVDLSRPLPAIGAEPGQGGVYVVFWRNDAPVGVMRYMAEQLPILPETLEALLPSIIAPAIANRLFPASFPAALRVHRSSPEPAPVGPLDAILSEASMMRRFAEIAAPIQSPASDETVSVVVCTRNRPAALSRCLQSLAAMASDYVEVIVVDNAPDRGEAAAVAFGRDKVRYVAEPRPGLSIARNTGARNARGSIIAFTDDDVVAHPRWISRLVAAFGEPNTLCVTGLVLPLELRTRSQVAFEFECGGLGRGLRSRQFRDRFEQMVPFGAPVWDIGAGANMAVRRSAFDIVGGFDERLGAGAAGCSEDSEFWYRVLATGYECRYEPFAVVFHEHREADEDLQRQLHAYMKGHVSALLVQYARHGHRGNLRRLLLALPGDFAARTLRAAKPSQRRKWPRLTQELTGYFAGFGALRWFRQTERSARPWRAEEEA
jgi:GT2 family glycosyltransferase